MENKNEKYAKAIDEFNGPLPAIIGGFFQVPAEATRSLVSEECSTFGIGSIKKEVPDVSPVDAPFDGSAQRSGRYARFFRKSLSDDTDDVSGREASASTMNGELPRYGENRESLRGAFDTGSDNIMVLCPNRESRDYSIDSGGFSGHESREPLFPDTQIDIDDGTIIEKSIGDHVVVRESYSPVHSDGTGPETVMQKVPSVDKITIYRDQYRDNDILPHRSMRPAPVEAEEAERFLASTRDAMSFFTVPLRSGPETSESDFKDAGISIDGFRAQGGAVSAGGNYIVGEEGPELLHMGNTSGTILRSVDPGASGGPVSPSIVIRNVNVVSNDTGGSLRSEVKKVLNDLASTEFKAQAGILE